MDEFSKLKKMWDQSFGGELQPTNKEQLLMLMQKKSAGPVDKLKKSLRIEIGAILIAIPMLILIMLELQKVYYIINTTILIAVFAGSLIYYFINLRKLQKIWSQSQQNLRTSLESTLMLVKFFRNTYFWLNIILFPFGMYFGYVIGFGLGSGGEKITSLILEEQLSLHMLILVGITVTMLLFTGFWFFLKFYVRKLYDVHIRYLEEIYKELTEFEHS